MSWNYQRGKFYVSRSGVFIFYIENNPCGCCPSSWMIEKSRPDKVRATTSFSIFSKAQLESIVNSYGLKELT